MVNERLVMAKKILLTSFDVWASHQVSNSSDDLVGMAIAQDWLPLQVQVLRRLPVDWQLAPAKVIAAIELFQPDLIVCCGMAEQRQFLTVESNGKCNGEILTTEIELEGLIENLISTHISYDAGNFVCNYLYYLVLRHLQESQRSRQCLFIHVPLLNEINIVSVGRDFATMMGKLAACQIPKVNSGIL
jgi:pyroglutamyl-peptidase